MYDIQTVVDRVRMVVMSDQYDETPELRQTAQDFADISRNLNTRLQRCGEYLRQGLRAEALEEAEAEPRLLDAVAVVESLSEEERSTWNDVCEFLDLPRADSMLADSAIMLDEAYHEHEPLEDLLRRHRRLALQRASLSQRLKVVRQLADEDPNTEFWEKDVDAYEAARIVEIKSELGKLSKRPNRDRLNELKTEVSSSDWKNKVPVNVIKKIKSLTASSERDYAQLALEEAEASLRDAFSAMNFDQATPAYESWQQNLAVADLEQDDPLILQALPALSWYEQEMERRSADSAWDELLFRIENKLDDKAIPLEELERLTEEAARYERPLPQPLGNRFETALKSKRMQKTRKRILIGVGAGAVTITLVVLGVLTMLRTQDNANRGRVIARIDELLTVGNVEEAEKLITQFDTRWNEQDDWLDIRAKTKDLADDLTQRRQKIDQLLLEASAVDDNQATRFQAVLADARKAANTPPVIEDLLSQTLTRIKTLESERQTRIKAYEEQLTKRLAAQGEAIEQLADELEETEKTEFDKATKRINEGLTLIGSDANGFDKRFGEEIKFYHRRILDLQNQYRDSVRRKRLIDDMTKFSRIDLASRSTKLESYINALKELSELSEGKPIAEQLRASLEETQIWLAIEAFSLTFPSLSDRLFLVSSEILEERSKTVEEWLAGHPNSPHIDLVREYESILRKLLDRHVSFDGEDSLVDSLSKLIVRAPEMNLYTVKDSGEAWPYYVVSPDPIKATMRKASFEAWGVINPSRESVNSNVTVVPQRSPQMELAVEFNNQLTKIRDAEAWEGRLGEMASMLIEKSAMDPILRLKVLYHLRNHARDGSLDLPSYKPFQEFSKELDEVVPAQVNPVGTNWADPDDLNASKEREIARQFLERQATIKDSWTPPLKRYEELKAKLDVTYHVLGWMNHDEKGKPRLDLDIPKSGNWRVVVARQDDDDSTSLTSLGSISGGEFQQSLSAVGEQFQYGRLVFAYLVR